MVRCTLGIFANPVLLCSVFSFLSPSSSSLYLKIIDKKIRKSAIREQHRYEGLFSCWHYSILHHAKKGGWGRLAFHNPKLTCAPWVWDRVVTGMVAQEILDACEEAAAATGGGGGGGSSETNLANPALGRYRYRAVRYGTVRFGTVWYGMVWYGKMMMSTIL